MKETGILDRILQRWMLPRKRCESHDVTSVIRLKQIRTAFYVLGTGMCISLLALATEIFILKNRMFRVTKK